MGLNPFITYHKNGQKHFKQWLVNNEFHRVDGPACRIWYKTGEVVYDYWYFNDKILEEDEIEEYKKWLIDNNLAGKPYTQWIDEEKMLWRLTWT